MYWPSSCIISRTKQLNSCRQRFTWSWGSIFVIMRSSKRLKVKTCSTYNWWAISSFMGLLLLITFWKTRKEENFKQMESITLPCRYYFPFLKHHFCFIFITLIWILCMKEATQIITLLLPPTTFQGLEENEILLESNSRERCLCTDWQNAILLVLFS